MSATAGFRTEEGEASRPVLLLLHAERTEATSRHAAALTRLVSRRVEVVSGQMSDEALLLSSGSDGRPIARFGWPADILAAARFLRGRGLVRVIVLQAGDADERLDILLDALAVPLDAVLFDHAAVARHPHLLDADHRFPGEEQASRFLRRRPQLFVARADRVFTVSRDLAERLERLAPGLGAVAALPPASLAPDTFKLTPPQIEREAPLDVVLIGELTPERGRDVALDLARHIHRDGHPLSLTLVGRLVPRPEAHERYGTALTLAGPTAHENLTPVLLALRPHVAWFPYQAPLSRDPTVDDALLNGLPVLATALGDLPERLRHRPFTCLLPPNSSATAWLDALLRLRREGGFSRAATPPPSPPKSIFDIEQFLRPLIAVRSR